MASQRAEKFIFRLKREKNQALEHLSGAVSGGEKPSQ